MMFGFLKVAVAPPAGFNHPLDDNLPSATSGRWKHSHACPNCKNDISHEEWMAKICETCGVAVENVFHWKDAVTRDVVRDGKWVKQKRIRGVNLISTDGQAWKITKDLPQTEKGS